MKNSRFYAVLVVLILASSLGWAQQRRKIIINEDCSGPAGSNLQTLLVLIQSPQVEVLGITVVSGDQWRDEEVAHTLRLLEIIGRTDIPVVPGAVFPLVHRREEAQMWQERYEKVAYAGAWDERWWHEPFVVPTLPEGHPTTKPADEDAAHDPEAAQIVLRAPWKKIICTPTDISIKTRLSPEMIKQIAASGTALAHYLARFYQPGAGANYMWDELAAAAWINPTLITKRETRYMGVDLDRGAGYGNTLTWTEKDKPKLSAQPVEIQLDLDAEKFYQMFVNLMSASTPSAH
jgi:inosine-uridine nucleoside N-ribohydrolase